MVVQPGVAEQRTVAMVVSFVLWKQPRLRGSAEAGGLEGPEPSQLRLALTHCVIQNSDCIFTPLWAPTVVRDKNLSGCSTVKMPCCDNVVN
ncbi:hypothetical protein KUCAC02_020912 [Chaenocephalus aceratus]|uniref:Uncharacterized protein n=1 Tax=Chaenocephalus aceratus TaxID=36190 RepID=A0ACB9XE10_CHAAC|nr:hypothetical protein KUCAC02_020912 [Chaenocephalus aceratus]